MYLFVYGTLKSGHRNNFYLEDQEFVTEAETEPFYRLFENGSFPFMIRSRHSGYSVSGEIWEVDEDWIDEIDAHEVLYKRKLIQVKDFDEEVWAYIYWKSIKRRIDMECYGIWG